MSGERRKTIFGSVFDWFTVDPQRKVSTDSPSEPSTPTQKPLEKEPKTKYEKLN